MIDNFEERCNELRKTYEEWMQEEKAEDIEMPSGKGDDFTPIIYPHGPAYKYSIVMDTENPSGPSKWCGYYKNAGQDYNLLDLKTINEQNTEPCYRILVGGREWLDYNVDAVQAVEFYSLLSAKYAWCRKANLHYQIIYCPNA